MNIETMEDLFLEQIEDLYDAEQRLIKALPKMAEEPSNASLRQAFSTHLEETRGHAARLESIFRDLDKKPKAETCDAMKGLISEGENLVSDIDESPLRDAGLIAAANRVEHYEIAAYGAAKAFAKALGLGNATKLLEQTLTEEKSADEKLTRIAETVVNPEAMRTSLAER